MAQTLAVPDPRREAALMLPERVKPSPVALNLPKGLRFEEWEEVGRSLARMEQGVMWWIGDWWAFGDAKYGERAAQALDPDSLAFQTFANAGWVARRFTETSRRREVLSWGHHAEVAALEPADADRFLDAAIEGDLDEKTGLRKPWPRQKLRAKVKKFRGLLARDEYLRDHQVGSGEVVSVDAVEWLKSLEEHSASLLLTDPPYSTDVSDIDEFARWWLPVALSRLEENGRAYVFTGAYPNELRAYLSTIAEESGWRCEDVLVWTWRNTLGPSGKGYMPNWQAILHIVGPKTPPPAFEDLLDRCSVLDIAAPDGRLEGRLDAWQKPDKLAELLVRHHGDYGETMIDPFAGTGTFLAAATTARFTAIGSETNPEMLALCEQRGLTVQ